MYHIESKEHKAYYWFFIIRDLGYFNKFEKMGRNSAGAYTVNEVQKIELSYLLKIGYIKKGCHVTGSLSWTNGNSIAIESKYTDNEMYIRLKYVNMSARTDEKKEFDYRIELTTKKSNLGKGELLYFVCPVNRTRCRILYKCYGSEIWKSRTAYRNRIYYRQQISSKQGKHTNRLSELETRLENFKNPVKSHYKGKETRIIKKQKRLIEMIEKENDLWYFCILNFCRKFDF